MTTVDHKPYRLKPTDNTSAASNLKTFTFAADIMERMNIPWSSLVCEDLAPSFLTSLMGNERLPGGSTSLFVPPDAQASLSYNTVQNLSSYAALMQESLKTMEQNYGASQQPHHDGMNAFRPNQSVLQTGVDGTSTFPYKNLY